MSASQKNCPFCNEPIRINAIKCRHCSSMLSDTPSSRGSLTGLDLVKQALGNRYGILEEIGRGGMATVYKAVQKNLNRPVALKVVHQNLIHDVEFINRFHREAQLCASLNHPNIVTVYDEGQVSGLHFMIMEYLEGTDLRNLIRSHGRLGTEQTIRYLLPVSEALDYAHGRGLIHRDIKSANIYITGSGRVILTDFGIAHAAAGIQITIEGTVIGTPEYMSPEQAAGRKVDHRTDIYSFGVVMYECLTGRVPLQGETTADTIYKVIHEQPHGDALQSVPGSLRELTLSLLSKDPDQRPNNAKQVEKALNLIKQRKIWRRSIIQKQKGPKRKVPAIVYLLAFIGIVLLGILVSHIKHQQVQEQKRATRIEAELPQQRIKDSREQVEAEQERIRLEQEKQEREEQRERQEAERLALQRDQQAWQVARSAGTISSYERYLRDFPSGRYAGQAKESISVLQSGTITDPRDGQVYKWVMIGNNVWMAENLNYATRSGSWCYNNQSGNCDKYGMLYNWETARNACPPGWHLPSDEEWTQLETFIGSNPGTILKAKSGWIDEGNGADDFGFSALPGGLRGNDNYFYGIYFYGRWWSSTGNSSSRAWYRGMSKYISGVYRNHYSKDFGFSVRCVRD